MTQAVYFKVNLVLAKKSTDFVLNWIQRLLQ